MSRSGREVAYSDFLARVDKGEVRGVTIRGQSITGHWTDGKSFRTYAADDPALVGTLLGRGVAVRRAPDDNGQSLRDPAITRLPILLLVGAAVFFLRRTPTGEQPQMGMGQSRAPVAMLFGGRVAEELIYGVERVTTCTADDIGQATALARRMVTEFGFNDTLGPLYFAEAQDAVVIGHAFSRHKNISVATARVIDHGIRCIVEQGKATARRVPAAHLDALHRLAGAPLERETLSSDEIDTVLRSERSDVGVAEAQVA